MTFFNNRLFITVEILGLMYSLPKDLQHLQLYLPSTGLSSPVILNRSGVYAPDQFPAPIPSISVAPSTLDDASSPGKQKASNRLTHFMFTFLIIISLVVTLGTSDSQEHRLKDLLYPEDCSDPVEAVSSLSDTSDQHDTP